MYFLYHEAANGRRVLLGRSDTETQARTLALDHSRGNERVISVREYRSSRDNSRLTCLARYGAIFNQSL